MKSLADALYKAGVLPKHTVEKHKKLQQERERSVKGAQHSKLTRKSRQPVNFDRLDTATSASAFRSAALALLLEHPDAIQEVIEKVHRLNEDLEGRKRLIWEIFQARDGIKSFSGKELEQFLRKGLRKAGRTFEVPKETVPPNNKSKRGRKNSDFIDE